MPVQETALSSAESNSERCTAPQLFHFMSYSQTMHLSLPIHTLLPSTFCNFMFPRPPRPKCQNTLLRNPAYIPLFQSLRFRQIIICYASSRTTTPTNSHCIPWTRFPPTLPCRHPPSEEANLTSSIRVMEVGVQSLLQQSADLLRI